MKVPVNISHWLSINEDMISVNIPPINNHLLKLLSDSKEYTYLETIYPTHISLGFTYWPGNIA